MKPNGNIEWYDPCRTLYQFPSNFNVSQVTSLQLWGNEIQYQLIIMYRKINKALNQSMKSLNNRVFSYITKLMDQIWKPYLFLYDNLKEYSNDKFQYYTRFCRGFTKKT